MPSASAIRLQIESQLARRIPSALTPAQKILRPVAPTGVAAVDALLNGGLPLGAITEFTGPQSSGRTSLALSYVARITQQGGVCAWIDASDSFHAESAAAAGVVLRRLLWVRCGVVAAPRHAENHFSLPDQYLVPAPATRGLHGGGFGPHPRTETRGLANAVGDLLKDPHCAEPEPRRRPEHKESGPVPEPATQSAKARAVRGKPWTRIEQALRATDLLLQDGGFRAIVLDMAEIAPAHVSRVELSTWFRYRAAAERTQASLVLLTQHSCAKSAGELLLRFQAGKPRCDEETVFTGLEHHLEVERRGFVPASSLRKPPQRQTAAHWQSQSTWAGAR
jgi:recombination protein RecA